MYVCDDHFLDFKEGYDSGQLCIHSSTGSIECRPYNICRTGSSASKIMLLSVQDLYTFDFSRSVMFFQILLLPYDCIS